MSFISSFRLTTGHIVSLKVVIHLASFLPLVWVFYAAISDQLGADPVEALLHFTGIGAFNLLLISLLVSPLAKGLKQAALMRVRRLTGLYAFFYALAHFVSYVLFELQLAWGLLVDEIVDRPYITVGFVALLILMALAVTSTRAIQRNLGKRWQTLHNLVYLAALLIALHYIWSVKSDISQPLVYWMMLIALLLFRRQKLRRLFTSSLSRAEARR